MMLTWKPVAIGLIAVGMVGLSGCQTAGIGGGDCPLVQEDELQRSKVAYQLGSGDEVRISVFNEADLSGVFEVDGVGNISIPLIGTIRVEGMTVEGLQREVGQRLIQGQYLTSPQVSAEVTNYRPYYMLGEIGNNGEFDFISGITVIEAVAAAGGFTYRANRRHVYIRGEDDAAERCVALTNTLEVRPGDTIRVDERLF